MFINALKRKKSHLRRKTCVGSEYDVIIHIGPPKTGTSAIQHLLLTHRKQLKELGYFYPTHKADKNNISAGHSDLRRAIENSDIALAREIITNYKRQASKAGATLLLSSEAFVYHHDTFQQLQDVLEVGKTAIVAFFRDPIDRILSTYNQTVKRHLNTTTLTTHCHKALNSDSSELSGMIFDQWGNIFMHEHVYIYPYRSYSNVHSRLEYTFLQSIGIPPEEHKAFTCSEAPINAGYTLSALELKRLLNIVLNQDEPKINSEIDVSLQRYSDHVNELQPRLSDMVDAKLFQALTENYKASNEHIKSTYLRGNATDFLDYSKGDTHSDLPEYSLRYTAKQIFSKEPSLSKYIKKLIQDKLDSGVADYSTLQLAEAFGFNISSYSMLGGNVESGRILGLINENAQLPDCLRELAMILERSGKYDEAFQLIKRALALRPGGPLIVKIHDRLKDQIN